ncbi:MAG: helix-turn-helix domain-containing protein [Nanoarchaeota archaeon]|nr:helix-turn-helix domain-containing protein [Nanoarchaeota archaeon]MBU4242009.1 helix-turn-helix domain-containing protein [Nanoarchaeota archaeon]MBU4352576.1 helix-turn-helix domain-containing protein [Nanoarchaeota archaeon]
MLSIKEREQIVKWHQQGKNQQEIADLIGCSQPTAHK